MYEDNRRFSWTNLFIKVIIVIIFILFTVWLLSLSTKSITKGMSKSLDVLTDNIFAQNVDRMKEVGKSYFTTERLPEKIGEVKTLSLAKMYDENLILEVKDKNGNACSAKNSYVSVEKLETEYQMKVYLECGEEADYVKVIMGCYNYCNSDICEKKTVEPVKNIEYQYMKTTGGSWGPWGAWTEWSKTEVTKNNYRDVETKVVKENYVYDKTITVSTLIGDATCPTVEGYTLSSSNNNVCTYTKTITDTKDPVACPNTSGGYNLVKQEGFNCTYSRTLTTEKTKCPTTYEGYDFTKQEGNTCYYSKTITETVDAKATTTGGQPITSQSCSVVGYETVRPCSTCGVQMVPIQSCTTVITGYTPVVTTYTCPTGYTRNNKTCSITKTDTKTTTAGQCPSGYTDVNGTCTKTDTKVVTASCPTNYTRRGDTCVKDNTYTVNRDKVCATGLRLDGGKCYKDETKVEQVVGVRDVTYYRYRLREYVGGYTDYKWSSSNNDRTLISAGYKLTGKTREVNGGK